MKKPIKIVPLLILLSSSVVAGIRPLGVLYPAEFVYLNGTEVDQLSPVLAGDVIRTKERGNASLQFSRSVALIPPESVVRIESGSLAIDTGTISMHSGEKVEVVIPGNLKITSAEPPGMRILARDFTVRPASTVLTEFDVTRSNGRIAITASKSTVLVICGHDTVTVLEGHRISRLDKPGCGFGVQ